MSNVPLAAKIKRDLAARRDQRVYERAVDSDRPMNHQAMAAGRFASTNRMSVQAFRDRSQDFLTSAELEMALERRTITGGRFRNGFLLFAALIVLVLMYAKYDVEMNIEVPQIENGEGFGVVADDQYDPADGVADGSKESGGKSKGPYKAGRQELDELEKHFKTLGVTGRFKPSSTSKPKPKPATGEDGSPSPAESPEEAASEAKRTKDADLERRRDMYRVKQEVRKARDTHNDVSGQLVACGRECRDKNLQVETAFQALDSVLPREVYSTFFGSDSKDGTKKMRTVSPADVDGQFEKNREKILNEMDKGDHEMALAELKDAYDIIRSPEARQYYQLYGRKPTESMKKTSARHGGWGVDLMMGTYKFRLIFAVLDYFSNTWAETILIGTVVVLLLARIPSIVTQTAHMQQVLEAQDVLDDMTAEE